VQLTVVVPIGKVSPEATTSPSPFSQTGVPPVAATVKLTGAPDAEVASTVMSPGPVRPGLLRVGQKLDDEKRPGSLVR
jgi:hypothetical protein